MGLAAQQLRAENPSKQYDPNEARWATVFIIAESHPAAKTFLDAGKTYRVSMAPILILAATSPREHSSTEMQEDLSKRDKPEWHEAR